MAQPQTSVGSSRWSLRHFGKTPWAATCERLPLRTRDERLGEVTRIAARLEQEEVVPLAAFSGSSYPAIPGGRWRS
jgi:hypothetical protein